MFKLSALAVVACIAVHAASPANAELAFEETTQAAGINHLGSSFGAAWGDFNADGHPDLWVGNHFDTPSLYINNVDGSFADRADDIWPGGHRDAHGAAWADLDNDGDQDLIETIGSGGASRVYLNEGGAFVDKASDWGLGTTGVRSRTPLLFDWNGDRFLDIVLTQALGVGTFPIILTNNGQRFSDAGEQTGVRLQRSTAAYLADLTGDGRPDLSLLDPSIAGFPGALYELESSPFTDRSADLQLGSGQVSDAVIADFNNDLQNDVVLLFHGGAQQAIQPDASSLAFAVVASASQAPAVSFTAGRIELEVCGISAGALRGGSAKSPLDTAPRPALGGGCLASTLDPAQTTVAGLPDRSAGSDDGVLVGFDAAQGKWVISVLSRTTLAVNVIVRAETPVTDLATLGFAAAPAVTAPRYFRQQAAGEFEDVTNDSGLDAPLPCAPGSAADFDNDMDLDLYLVCTRASANEPNVLLENLGDGRFRAVAEAGGAAGSREGRGESVAVADYDGDGWLDLFLTNGEGGAPFNRGPHQLFRNKASGNHWLQVELIGTASNPGGVGAELVLETGNVRQLREYAGGLHQRAQDFQIVHFGLADHTEATRLSITWPSGCTQTIENIAADQRLKIAEPCGELDHQRVADTACAVCHEVEANHPSTAPVEASACSQCHSSTDTWAALTDAGLAVVPGPKDPAGESGGSGDAGGDGGGAWSLLGIVLLLLGGLWRTVRQCSAAARAAPPLQPTSE